MGRIRTTLDYAVALLPGAATALLGFQAGGFFPDSWSLLACVLGLLLMLRVTVAERPFEGFSAPLLVALAALGMFAVWTLASAWWSHSPGRAVVEYSRVLAYLLMLALVGSARWSRRRTTVALAGVLAGIAIVVGAGLLSRLLPDLVSAPLVGDPRRLAWPVTYWNGLGLLAAVGMLVALHLCAWTGGARTLRPLAAAMVPPLACALYLTLSRGAIIAGALGLLVYLVLGRPRGLVCALLAVVPPTVVATLAAYRAPGLLGFDPSLPQTVAEGRHVADALWPAMLAATGLRALLLPVDAWLERLRPPAMPRALKLGAVAVVGVVLAGAAFATGASGWARTQGQTLFEGSAVRSDDVRTRLLTVDNDGRFALWRVSLDAFNAHPLAGTGAGTYEVLWKRDRRQLSQVIDAHSLYAQTLGELGLVGMTLLLTVLLTLLGATAWRARGRERPLYAAVLAVLVTWATHASLDWDWQLTATSMWAFGLAGAALSAAHGSPLGMPLGRVPRICLALGCAVLLLVPLGVWRSQVRLADAVAALRAGDCAETTDAALDSIEALSGRADPWELLTYCDLRAGRPALAIRAARTSVRLDPESWDHHYALAVALAIGGQDPRPAATATLRLNPLEPRAQELVRAFSSGGPRTWARRAGRLPLGV